jgi:outer membrane protein assembly factor BamA
MLGPIRLDYAYPTSKAPTDITQRLNFRAVGFLSMIPKSLSRT